MATRRGFGRIRRRSNGRYQAGYVGPDTAVHYGPTTFPTKWEAEGWLRDEQRLIERDEWTPPKARQAAKHHPGATLADYAPTWLAGRRQRRTNEPLKPRTREHYQYLLDTRILPMLGSLPMHAIDEDVVQAWLDAQPNTPTANAHAYALLKSILTTAAKKDDRITPPAIEGAGKADTKHKAEPATAAELHALADHMPPRYRLAVLLMGWCALRFGEVAELRRQDIAIAKNGKTGKVRVRRAVVRVGGERIVTTPKSDAGIRDVSIPPHILGDVRQHLKEWAQPGPTGLLFPGANGRQVSQSTLNGKPARTRLQKGSIIRESASGFCKAREAIGRPDLRMHDLRHSGATLAAQTGATLRELMERLGHSTSEAALRYQHAARDRDAQIAESLSRMVEHG